MKTLLEQLAAYNIWANERLFNVIDPLTDDLLRRELPTSFKSLHGTLYHMWQAESIWWQRLKQEALTRVEEDAGLDSLKKILLEQNRKWHDWVTEEKEETILQILEYQNLQGKEFRQPVYEILLHIFNHGTYHRGQLVNILRQLGVHQIAQTDFIVFSRM